MNQNAPKYVNIQEDNIVKQIPYKELIKHEELIIADNMFYGVKNGFSKKEIKDYEKEAHEQLKDLKKRIFENPEIILEKDFSTERYLVKESPEK